MKVVRSRINWDKLGACASAVCAVHCMLTGFALGLLSVAGWGFLDSPLTDGLFITAAMILGTVAAIHGIRKHHSIAPSIVFILSLCCVVAGHFVVRHHTLASTIFNILGGTGLVGFHWLNLRLRKDGKCACGCDPNARN